MHQSLSCNPVQKCIETWIAVALACGLDFNSAKINYSAIYVMHQCIWCTQCVKNSFNRKACTLQCIVNHRASQIYYYAVSFMHVCVALLKCKIFTTMLKCKMCFTRLCTVLYSALKCTITMWYFIRQSSVLKRIVMHHHAYVGHRDASSCASSYIKRQGSSL